MGGKKGVESKKEKDANKKAESGAKAAKDTEDADWAAAGDGAKGKGAKKKEDEERKKLETAAKKAELKRLADEEEKSMVTKKKGDKTPAGVQKLTKFQMEQQRALEDEIKLKEIEKKKLSGTREVAEDEYASMVETSNPNRDDSVLVDARNVGEALSGLGIGADTEADKHPEKRRKAAWLTYEEANLPELRQEKPGLKMSQYKEMLWKTWQKAPENPVNAAKQEELNARR